MISRIMSKAMMCGRDFAPEGTVGGADGGAEGLTGALRLGATVTVAYIDSTRAWCGPVSESVVLTIPPSPGP
jgi:hypothetical protein